MGITHIEAEIFTTADNHEKVLFLVDSGAGYSLVPREVWNRLGLQARRTVTVALADGSKLTREVSECRFLIDGIEAGSPVILGEDEDEALLGAVTLENLGLVLDPYRRKLLPMQVRA